MKTCPVCGKEFEPNVPHHKYCSLACQRKACYERLKADPVRYERHLNKHRMWLQAHPEKCREYRFKCYWKQR